MNNTQISSLRRYIDENKGLSNNALAILVNDKSKTFKDNSVGTIANYIGQVKKLDKKVVSTTPGHIMATPQRSIKTKVAEIRKAKEEKPVYNFGHDVLIVNANMKLYCLDQYLNDEADQCIRTLIEFGDDTRFLGKFVSPEKEFVNTNLTNSSIGGIDNEYSSLYDAINITINELINEIDECEKTPVNITILTDSPDFGSQHCDHNNSGSLINKVSRRFGWAINLLYLGEDNIPKHLGRLLSIDSTNIYATSDELEFEEKLFTARRNKNSSILNNKVEIYNYFK